MFLLSFFQPNLTCYYKDLKLEDDLVQVLLMRYDIPLKRLIHYANNLLNILILFRNYNMQ